MRTGARLHTYQARRQGLEELQQLGAAQLPAEHDLAPLADPVSLKDVLRKIKTNDPKSGSWRWTHG